MSNRSADKLADAARRLIALYVNPSFISCITPPARGEYASARDNFEAGRSEVWKAWDDLGEALAELEREKGESDG